MADGRLSGMRDVWLSSEEEYEHRHHAMHDDSWGGGKMLSHRALAMFVKVLFIDKFSIGLEISVAIYSLMKIG